MSSRFIHVVAYVSSFLCKAEYYSVLHIFCLSIHLLLDPWIDSPLSHCEYRCREHECTYIISLRSCFQFLDIYPKVKLLDHMAVLTLILNHYHSFFRIGWQFCISISSGQEFCLFPIHSSTSFSGFYCCFCFCFNNSHPLVSFSEVIVVIVLSICILLMIGNWTSF